MKRISVCRICGSQKIIEFFDLGTHPPANALIKNKDEKENQYPLSLSWCQNCCLAQLTHTVDPGELFSHYLWVTGTSKITRDYAEEFYANLITKANIPADGYVLEIASNDGTFLKPFQKKGFNVLGIDPAKNIVELANKDGIPTECLFFSEEVAQNIVDEYGFANIIIARNVVPHVANTIDFIKGIAVCLDDEGILAIEVHYAKVILEDLHYDSIYHEHLCYFTLKTLERLLANANLFIFDIAISPINGGALVVYAKKTKTKESLQLEKIRRDEITSQVNVFEKWQEFADRAYAHRDQLRDIITIVKNTGSKIIGYGSSARSSTLLNFSHINYRTIAVIADKNPLKHNLLTAGSHIPITSPEESLKEKPSYIFILAWNFADEIMEYLENELGYQGDYIIPLPSVPRILKNRKHNK